MLEQRSGDLFHPEDTATNSSQANTSCIRTKEMKNKNWNGMQRMVIWCCLLMNPHEIDEARSIQIRVLVLDPRDRPRPLVTVLGHQRRRLAFSRISLSCLTGSGVRTSVSVMATTDAMSHP
jgi:hypothetical protein